MSDRAQERVLPGVSHHQQFGFNFRLRRLICKAFVFASIVLISDLSFAQESPKVAQRPESCHAEIKLLSPTAKSEYDLLSPVNYHFVETHDDKCQMTIRMKQEKSYACRQTDIHLTLLNQSDGTTRVQNEITVVCRYRLAGYYFSSPLYVDYHAGEVLAQTLVLPNTEIHVKIPPLDPSEEAQLHRLQPWHRSIPVIIWWILGGIVLALVSLYVNEKRRREALLKAEREASNAVEAPSPIESFMAKISPLLEATPETESEIKAFYDQLSEALRNYMSERLMLPVMESTTRQLRSKLEGNLAAGHIDELIRILSECDLVKFSRIDPSPTKRMSLVRDTSILVSSVESYLETRQAQLLAPDRVIQKPVSATDASLSATSLLVSVDFDPSAAQYSHAPHDPAEKSFTPRNIWTVAPNPVELQYDSQQNDLEGIRVTNSNLSPARMRTPVSQVSSPASHPSKGTPDKPVSEHKSLSQNTTPSLSEKTEDDVILTEEELLDKAIDNAFSGTSKRSSSQPQVSSNPEMPAVVIPRSKSGNRSTDYIPQLLSTLRPKSSHLTPVETQATKVSPSQSYQDILGIFSDEEIRLTRLDQQPRVSPISIEGMDVQELWLIHSHSYSSGHIARAQDAKDIFNHALDTFEHVSHEAPKQSLRQTLETHKAVTADAVAQEVSAIKRTPNQLDVASLTKDRMHQQAPKLPAYHHSSTESKHP